MPQSRRLVSCGTLGFLSAPQWALTYKGTEPKRSLSTPQPGPTPAPRGGSHGASPLAAGSGGRGLKQSKRGKQLREQ